MKLPKRKPTRLKGFDYSEPRAYFITICSQNRIPVFSHIYVGQGLAPAENRLTKFGAVAKEQIERLEVRYPGITIDHFVVMPNYIHLLISLQNETAGASPCPTIPQILCSFKSLTARACKKLGFEGEKLFQSSYHDHIIRGEKDYRKIWEYIDTNVLRWELDCFYDKR